MPLGHFRKGDLLMKERDNKHRAAVVVALAAALLLLWGIADTADAKGKKKKRARKKPDIALHMAVKAGDLHKVRQLVDQGKKVDLFYSTMQTPLHQACLNGHHEIATYLIERKARIRNADLVVAVTRRRSNIVGLLLKHGANPNTSASSRGSKRPLLFTAIEKRDVRTAAALAEGGANLDRADKDVGTPLEYAIKLRHRAMVDMLVAAGASTPKFVPKSERSKKRSIFMPEKTAAFFPLHMAVALNQQDLVAQLLKDGEDVNAVDAEGQTPLIWAVRFDRAELVPLLKSAGARLNEATSGGAPLHHAVKGGKHAMVPVLIKAGADIDGSARQLGTPLSYAVTEENLGMISTLLDAGAKIDASGADAWSVAVSQLSSRPRAGSNDGGRYERRRKIALMLVERVDFVNRKRDPGLTPVIRHDYVEMLDRMLARGAQPNKAGSVSGRELPLNVAIKNDNAAAVKRLLKAGADPNLAHDDRQTPLQFAVERNRYDLVVTLIEAGGDVSSRGKISSAPLHLAMEGGSIELVRLLLDRGAPVNEPRNGTLITPLYLAARHGHAEVVELLLERGANVNGARRVGNDRAGQAPLIVAAGFGHLDVAKRLLDHGADVHGGRSGSPGTPIGSAAGQGRFDMIRLLVARGANVNDGGRPLASAIRRQNVEMVRWLLSKGANPNQVKGQDRKCCLPDRTG